MGRTINSFSGGFNTAATVVVQGLQIFNFDGEVTTGETDDDFAGYSYGLKMLRLIEKAEDAVAADAAADTKPFVVNFGKILGKIFTKFFNVQVPDVQYQVYN